MLLLPALLLLLLLLLLMLLMLLTGVSACSCSSRPCRAGCTRTASARYHYTDPPSRVCKLCVLDAAGCGYSGPRYCCRECQREDWKEHSRAAKAAAMHGSGQRKK